MHSVQANTARGPIVTLPCIFGGVGLLVGIGYQAQRSGVFLQSFYWLDRFIQCHLDAIAFVAVAASLLGVVSGMLILRFRGRDRFVAIGTGISLVALLWSVFGLSL